MEALRRHYDRVVCVDFEYGTGATGADPPSPRCVVAKEIFSQTTTRLWLDGRGGERFPFPLDDRTLYVAYYLPAEINCHIAMGWPIPCRAIDLFVEFRWMMNGLNPAITDEHKRVLGRSGRFSLLNAMYSFGLASDAVDAGHKDNMRDLSLRGGDYSHEERRELLAYNETDVVALEKLLPRMLPSIELGPALLRGRYMCAVGAIERFGIPIDGPLIRRLKSNWEGIIDRLIDSERGELDVIHRRDVDQDKFADWLRRNGIDAWPYTPTGALDTSSDTLSERAKYPPLVMRLKEFLHAVRRTRLFANLQIGDDDRNRFLLSPFGSKTGRNTPSNSRSVFGPATWVRSLIKPAEGHSIIYCDWSGQEYGEAAYFSNDPLMIHDYANDDPYLGFAKRIKLVPSDATKRSHKKVRNQLKIAAGLGVLYGAQAETVARVGDMSESQAKRVLRYHQLTYPKFLEWRRSVISRADLHGELRSMFGWKWVINDTDKSPSISNFVMQANGAEMLRIAVCLAVESGIKVVAPVHDALMIHCPTKAADEVTNATLECMRQASNAVLGGDRELTVGVEPAVHWPNRYSDCRGRDAWDRIMELLESVDTLNSQPSECLIGETRNPGRVACAGS